MGEVDLRDELLAIVREFNRAGIPYALCGGLAVGVHGFPRATEDIDLMILLDDLAGAKEVLRECGFMLESGRIPLGVAAGKPRDVYRVSKVIGGEHLMVDLMIASKDLAAIWEGREKLSWRGEVLWVVSRQGLIELKKDANRAIDLADIERLEGYESNEPSGE